MDWAETIEKSKELDRLLRFDDEPRGTAMAIGGHSLNLSDLVADVGKAFADAKATIAAELRDLAEETRANTDASVKKIRAERASANAAFTDILGNELASGQTDEKKPAETGDGNPTGG